MWVDVWHCLWACWIKYDVGCALHGMVRVSVCLPGRLHSPDTSRVFNFFSSAATRFPRILNTVGGKGLCNTKKDLCFALMEDFTSKKNSITLPNTKCVDTSLERVCMWVCVCGWWRSAASINIHSIIFFSFLCSGPLKHLLWLWGTLRFIFELLLLTNRMVMRCCTCWSAAGAGSPCSSRGWSPAGPWPETWGPRWIGESPADCSHSPQTATAPGLYTGKPNQHVNPQEPKGNP